MPCLGGAHSLGPVTAPRQGPLQLVSAALLSLAALVACSGTEQPATPGGGRASGSASSSATGAASGGRSAEASGTPSERGAGQVYVAVGASETVGVGADSPDQAWPRVLHDSALPGATLVNVGVSGATVDSALGSQLPRALDADPDVVTVWLAVNDIVALVPPARYERRLRQLVHALRRDGRTRVLVGNAPQVWRLPAYRACLPSSEVSSVPCLLPVVPEESLVRDTVAAYNAAVARVTRAEGATLVDLSRRAGLAGLTSSDGFHPSTRGHEEIAEAFARALRS